MIDPHDCTNLNRSDAELEEFFLFCVMVANKPADQTRDKLARLLGFAVPSETPFAMLRRLDYDDRLADVLQGVRAGQYRRILGAIRDVLGRDLGYRAHYRESFLRHVTTHGLEAIPGVGPKTARYFLLHTQKGARVAALDTHVLKMLRENGHRDAPRSTPPAGATYRLLEAAFLRFADRVGMTPAAFDLLVWTTYTKSERRAA